VVDVRERYNFDERVRHAVEVEEVGGWWLLDSLRGILFHLNLLYAYCN
jgi:hypothetical protein